MVEKETIWGHLTVTVQGEARAELVQIGNYDRPNIYESVWVQEPEIVDVHNYFYDVTLTPEEEREILNSLDIDEFVR